MTTEAYQQLLGKSTVYIGIDRELREMSEALAEKIRVDGSEQLLEKWREKYRKNM